MPRVLAAEAAVLAQLEPLGRLLLVLGRAVVAPLTLVARQSDDVSHNWTLVRLQAPGSRLQAPARHTEPGAGHRALPEAWYPVPEALFNDLGDRAGADGAAALTNREPRALLERDRNVQFGGDAGVVARHHHLDALRQLQRPGD